MSRPGGAPGAWTEPLCRPAKHRVREAECRTLSPGSPCRMGLTKRTLAPKPYRTRSEHTFDKYASEGTSANRSPYARARRPELQGTHACLQLGRIRGHNFLNDGFSGLKYVLGLAHASSAEYTAVRSGTRFTELRLFRVRPKLCQLLHPSLKWVTHELLGSCNELLQARRLGMGIQYLR